MKPTFKSGFDTNGWIILGVGALGGLLLSTQDQYLNPKGPDELGFSNQMLEFGDFMGTGIPGLLIALTQYRYDKEVGANHLNALAYTILSTWLIKEAVTKTRPNGANPHSFPSGHTSAAFASATSLYMSYGWTWGVPAFFISTFVGLERMAENAHWASDVWTGAALGIFWARATHRKDPDSLKVTPFWGPEGKGLALSRNF